MNNDNQLLINNYFDDLSYGLPFSLSEGDIDIQKIFAMVDEFLIKNASIGEGVDIRSGVVIDGPVWIGDNVVIGTNAIIRPGSVIGNDCIVGAGAEIKNSICMGGSKIQSGSFLGDSIIGREARIGSGTVISNRRFDQASIKLAGEDTGLYWLGAIIGDEARFGANASSSPGTIIGKRTLIGSQVTAYGVIPEDKLILVKQELDVRDR